MNHQFNLARLWLIFVLVILSACRQAGVVETVNVEDIARHIKYLSSDLLEGRAIGSRGIELAASYQEDYFRIFGLEPVFNGSFRQKFFLRGISPDLLTSLKISTPSGGREMIPKMYDDFVVISEVHPAPEEVSGEIVYCGYLIQAPERDWDDVKGVDLKGKILLCEINEPGNKPGGIFDGKNLTYYGRWIYKFEKASELKAAGVLIIHNTEGALYGWDVVRNSWAREKFILPEKENNLNFQGWVSGELGREIVKMARFDYDDLAKKAERADFVPVPLGLQCKVHQNPGSRLVEATNIAGIIRAKGANVKNRMIVISAHYDHLGRDESLEGDQIYNGAVDNCSATAAMLELAGYYARNPETLQDDLCFLAATAEEELFLGSDYFVRHLPFPQDKVLANLNFEMTNVWGETEDVFAIGASLSELDDICRKAAQAIGLNYTEERNQELGFLFRSDQFSFIRGGLPGVWLHHGVTSRGKDKNFVNKKFQEYLETKYHKVTDEFDQDWDLRGTLQMINWAKAIIKELSSRESLPEFLPLSPFQRKRQ